VVITGAELWRLLLCSLSLSLVSGRGIICLFTSLITSITLAPSPLCCLSPESLVSVFLTGGLPPLVNGPDEVYTRLCARILSQNNRYYARYPEDVERAQKIAAHLQANDVTLPNGGKLT